MPLKQTNILNAVGGVDVGDADAAVADVKDPKTFYSVAPPKKTGTMPTVAIVAANDDYPAGYHAGNVGGLDAIDLDLASANIKSGVTIFGKLGTFVGALAEDVEGDTVCVVTELNTAAGLYSVFNQDINTEYILATKTLNFNASSLAFAAGFSNFSCAMPAANFHKLRLYMGGVQMQESAFITLATLNYVLRDFKAMVGIQECKIVIRWYVAFESVMFYGKSIASQYVGAIAVGSVKLMV